MPLTVAEQREMEELELRQLEAKKAAATAVGPARMAAPPAGAKRFAQIASMPGMSSEQSAIIAAQAGARAGGMPMRQDMPPEATRAALGQYVRAAPLAAGLAFPPTSVASVAGLAGTGFLSEMMARGMEGKSVTNPEAFGEAGKSAVLSGMPVPGMRPATGIVRPVMQGVKFAGTGMATSAAAESAKSLLSEGELTPYDSLKDAFKETWKTGVIGGLLGGVGSRLGAIGDKQAAFDARMKLLTDIGSKEPTLAMKHPSMTGWEQNVARRDPMLMEKQAAARSEITRNFYRIMGDAPPNEEIGRQMQGMVGKIDEAEAGFKLAQEKAAKAKEALAQADAAAAQGLPTPEIEKIKEGATAALINSVNEQAANSFKSMAAMGNNVTNTAMAGDLAKVFTDLSAARTAISGQKYGKFYKAAGISETTPIFNKQDILDAATAALKEHADTPTGLSIIDDIKRVAAKVDGEQLSSAQLQDLRNHMAASFAGGAEGAMNNAERLASQAYAGITKNARNTIEYVAPHAVPYLDDATKFWAETAELKNSPLGRSLLQRVGGEAADTTLTSIASGMAAGNVDELDKFRRFVDVIGAENKAVQTQALQTMSGALRNAFITKHSKTGATNLNGLLDDLSGAANYDRLPVPVETLGFGDRATIKEWQSVLKKYKPEDVNNPAVLDSVLANPSVQRVLVSGGTGAGKTIDQATARALFERDVAAQVALVAAGKTKEAQEAAKMSRVHAADANISRADAERYFDSLRSDPVLSAFSGQGKFTFSNEAGNTGKGTITDLMFRMPRDTSAQLMQALRNKQPMLAELVESRLIANEMSQFLKPNPNAKGGGEVVDFLAARNYFKPTDRDAPYFKLRDILGAKRTDQLKGFVEKVGDLSDQMRRGQVPTDGDIKSLMAIAGTQGAVGVNAPSWSRFAFINKVVGMANSKAYNAMAEVFKNPDFARALYSTSGTIADAITSLPAQKAYPLMMNRPLMEELGRLDSTERQPQNPGLSPMEPPR